MIGHHFEERLTNTVWKRWVVTIKSIFVSLWVCLWQSVQTEMIKSDFWWFVSKNSGQHHFLGHNDYNWNRLGETPNLIFQDPNKHEVDWGRPHCPICHQQKLVKQTTPTVDHSISCIGWCFTGLAILHDMDTIFVYCGLAL